MGELIPRGSFRAPVLLLCTISTIYDFYYVRFLLYTMKTKARREKKTVCVRTPHPFLCDSLPFPGSRIHVPSTRLTLLVLEASLENILVIPKIWSLFLT